MKSIILREEDVDRRIAGWQDAPLPEIYSSARDAIARCERIDECLSIDDRAAMLAAYGRQIKDNQMVWCAMRIKMRAKRRAGEMLLEMPSTKLGGTAGTRSKGERQIAAEKAGISTSQKSEILNIARVPGDVFEEAVEKCPPSGINSLLRDSSYAKGVSAPNARKYAVAARAIRSFLDGVRFTEPALAAAGAMPDQAELLKSDALSARAWVIKYVAALARGQEANEWLGRLVDEVEKKQPLQSDT